MCVVLGAALALRLALSSDLAYVAAINALMDNFGLWQAHSSDDFTYDDTAEPGVTPDIWYTA